MNEAKQEILNIIANYCKENPNQRFGQILFNLNINEFKKVRWYVCFIIVVFLIIRKNIIIN